MSSGGEQAAERTEQASHEQHAEAEQPPFLASDTEDSSADQLTAGDMSQLGEESKSYNNLLKKTWTAEEDRLLAEIVTREGAHKWSMIAASLPGRAGKQCRERWYNHLCPDVRKGSWTAEEDRIIMESVREHGTRWSFIVKLLPGRTDNAIKNRYNSAMRKQRRLQMIEEAAANGVVLPIRPRGRPEGSGNKAKRKREEDKRTRAEAGEGDENLSSTIASVSSPHRSDESRAEIVAPMPKPRSKLTKKQRTSSKANAARYLKDEEAWGKSSGSPVPSHEAPTSGMALDGLPQALHPGTNTSPCALAQSTERLSTIICAGDAHGLSENLDDFVSATPTAGISPAAMNWSCQSSQLSPSIMELLEMAGFSPTCLSPPTANPSPESNHLLADGTSVVKALSDYSKHPGVQSSECHSGNLLGSLAHTIGSEAVHLLSTPGAIEKALRPMPVLVGEHANEAKACGSMLASSRDSTHAVLDAPEGATALVDILTSPDGMLSSTNALAHRLSPLSCAAFSDFLADFC